MYAEILLMNSKTTFGPKSQLESVERKAFLVTMQSRIRIEFQPLEKGRLCACFAFHISMDSGRGGFIVSGSAIAHNERLVPQIFPEQSLEACGMVPGTAQESQ